MATGSALTRRLEWAVRDACKLAGLSVDDMTAIRIHSNGVFRLPAEQAVVRLGAGAEASQRAERAVAITTWLHQKGIAVVEPINVPQPVVVKPGGELIAVTFWRWIEPDPGRSPGSADVGRLLRQVHALPLPPFRLPPLRPMGRFLPALENGTALAADDQAWLRRRAEELLTRYHELDFPLGPPTLLHGDAQSSNLIAAADGRTVAADWDATAIGPREWDLVVEAAGDRFGVSAAERAEGAHTYGFDVTTWPDWTVLRDLRELHALGAHIRRAPDSPPHAAELRHRIASLRAGDRRLWHAVG